MKIKAIIASCTEKKSLYKPDRLATRTSLNSSDFRADLCSPKTLLCGVCHVCIQAQIACEHLSISLVSRRGERAWPFLYASVNSNSDQCV